MKNYYEILEVSEKASPEVIEKAYKALVKKYHPDLQPQEKKQEAENKIKLINEAYDILSDKIKKEQFDEQLKAQKIKDDELKYAQLNKKYQNSTNNYNSTINRNSNINSNYQYTKKRIIKTPISHINNDWDYSNDFSENINNAYNQAYINNLKNMGYEIKYERTFKERIKIFFSMVLAIFVLVIIFFILWHIPFIKKYFTELYNTNEFIKLFVDIINNIVSSFIGLIN